MHNTHNATYKRKINMGISFDSNTENKSGFQKPIAKNTPEIKNANTNTIVTIINVLTISCHCTFYNIVRISKVFGT